MESNKIEEDKNIEITDKLIKVLKDLMSDILTTFPEYSENLDNRLKNILEEEPEKELLDSLYEYIKTVYPERFFDILYQNDSMFDNKEIDTNFLPGVDFSVLMKEDITSKTKDVLWKY